MLKAVVIYQTCTASINFSSNNATELQVHNQMVTSLLQPPKRMLQAENMDLLLEKHVTRRTLQPNRIVFVMEHICTSGQ